LLFKPCGGCRFIHRQPDGFVSLIVTVYHPMAFSSPVGFPSGWATSGLASWFPAARLTARGGVSVMAYIPVSFVRNRPFIPEICCITCSNFLGPNRIMGRVPDCTSLGAIRFELAATVATMISGIRSQTGMSGGNEFVPIGWITLE
jgi:hypothetical protein